MAAAAIDDLTYVGLDKRAHGRVRNDDFTIIGRMRAHFAAFEAAITVNVSLVGIFKKFKELEGELTKELSFEYFKLCLHRIRHPEKNKAYPRKKQVVSAPVAAPISPPQVAPVAIAEKFLAMQEAEFPKHKPTPAPIAPPQAAPVATPVAAALIVEPPQSEEDEFAGLNARQRREKRIEKIYAELGKKESRDTAFLKRLMAANNNQKAEKK